MKKLIIIIFFGIIFSSPSYATTLIQALDLAYKNNKSPIQQKIIDLIRSKGGKRGSEL